MTRAIARRDAIHPRARDTPRPDARARVGRPTARANPADDGRPRDDGGAMDDRGARVTRRGKRAPSERPGAAESRAARARGRRLGRPTVATVAARWDRDETIPPRLDAS